MSDLNCPYCNAELSVYDVDGFDQEDVNHQMECGKCEKSFVFQTSISYYFEAEKADCLNDGNHDWKKTHTIPDCFSEMECTMCGDRRALTQEERMRFNIQTPEEYLNEIKGGNE
jgi:hypothetical protein